MWIVRIALNRPYTFIVAALAIILMTPIVLQRTPTDVFPDIDIPVISIAWNYSGLSPQQMEERIVSPFERFITYSASTVPILQLGLRGQGLSEQELFDYGANLVRNQLATVAGAAIPWPYGGKQRQVSVNLDIPALQAKGLSPVDVINAISTQNLVLPSGTVKMGSTEFNVEMNGSPSTIAALNNLPIRTSNGTTIYVQDVAVVSDGFSPQVNIARMEGQRGVLLSVYKTGCTSSLDVVSQFYANL